MEAHPRRHIAVNQSSLRSQNLRVVARALWGAGGGLSRADLASVTGLTRATVSRLVAELISANLVAEGGATESGQPGRPGTLLCPAATTVAAIGLDINVDHVSGRVIDLAGTVLGEFAVASDPVAEKPEAVLAELGRRAVSLARRVRRANPRLELCGSALAVPGLVSDSSRVRLAPNLGWRELVPADLLGRVFVEQCGPLVVENDAKLQALAASRLAPGHLVPEPTFIYIGGDIGVGGGLVEAGELRRGSHGWAGEIGHMTIDPRGPLCTCGARGCLECYAGRRAVYAAAGLAAEFGSQQLVQRLREDDPAALRAIRRAGEALGIAIANALNLLDIRQVVLGTSLAEVAVWLFPEITRTIDQHLLWSDFESVLVTAAPVDRLPAVTGGAYHVLERVLDDPAGWIEAHSEAWNRDR